MAFHSGFGNMKYGAFMIGPMAAGSVKRKRAASRDGMDALPAALRKLDA